MPPNTEAPTWRPDQEDALVEATTRIRALDDRQLGELHDRIWHSLFDRPDVRADLKALAEPVNRAHAAIYFIIDEERNHREAAAAAIEADLMGGHLVEVLGARGHGYRASCHPDPYAEDGCWEGPDRATIEQALEDGRRHNPGHEPRLVPALAKGQEGIG